MTTNLWIKRPIDEAPRGWTPILAGYEYYDSFDEEWCESDDLVVTYFNDDGGHWAMQESFDKEIRFTHFYHLPTHETTISVEGLREVKRLILHSMDYYKSAADETCGGAQEETLDVYRKALKILERVTG